MAGNNLDLQIRIRANADGTQSVIVNTSNSINALGNNAESAAVSTNRLSGAMRAAARSAALFAASFVGFKTVSSIIRSADHMQQLEARVKLATKETGDFTTVYKELERQALKTGSAFETGVNLFQTLARTAPELKATSKDILQLTETVQLLGATSGATKEAMKNALTQFSQGMAGGVLRAEEFNSIVENTPAIANAIARGMGKTSGELRLMVIEGKALSKDVFNALLSQTEKAKADFAEMPLSIGALKNVLDLSFGGFIDDANKSLDGVNSITGAMRTLSNVIISMDGAVAASGLVTLSKILAVSGAIYVGTAALSVMLPIVATGFASLQLSASLAMTAMAVGVTPVQLLTTSLAASARATMANVVAFGLLKSSAALLFSAFAGWEIGSFLRDNFVEAKVSGLAFVGAMLTGFENLKYGGTIAWEGIKFIANSAMNGIKSEFSGFLEWLSSAADSMGFDGLSSRLNYAASNVAPLVSAYDEFTAATEKAKVARDAEIASIDDNITALVAFELAKKTALNDTPDSASNTEKIDTIQTISDAQMDASNKLQQSFDKELEKLIAKNITLAAGERALFTYQLAQKGFTAEQKKTALAIYDANKAMEKQKKAASDASKSQKAENKKMADDLKGIDRYLNDISASSQDIFSGPADSINNMANGINAMSKALDVNRGYVEENQKAWAEFNKSKKGTDEERAQKAKELTDIDNALAKKSVDIKLQGFNTVGSAFVGMFNDMAAASEEGSKKQEALQKTAMGITMVMATINGVAAVIAAFKDGGFPMAIAVGAAVAAQLATIGVQMAAIGGGSSAPELQKTQGRGTVLGDAGAVSESFSNALEHLEDSTDYSLVQSSKMIVFLQNIDNNTKALAIGINRSDQYQKFSASPTFGLGKNLQGDALKMSNAITGFNDMLGSIPVFGGALRGLANALFGYKEDIRDTGVSFNKEQTLGQAKEQGLDANYYARVDTYQKIFGFRTNTETLNLEQAIEGEISTWFNGIVNNSTDAVLAGLEVLAGDGYAALEDKILNSTLNLEKISLKDLDTTGVEEALAGVFSASADKLVADSFPILDSFQQVGEGMFETLVRVSHGVEQAQVSLSQFGFQAIDFTEIINKQGDTGGQVAKQTILLNEEFDNIVDVMKNVSGSTEDVIGVYTDLIKTQRLLISSGFGDNVDLVSAGNASGGIGNLQSGIESYRENFMTDSQRLQADLNDMATDFKTLGVVFPGNINDYTKAVTEAGFDIRTATQEFMKGVATPEDLGRTLQLADVATQLYSDWGRLNEVLRENTVVLQQTYDRLGQSDIEKTLRGIAESFTDSIVSIAEAGGTAEQMLQALNLGLLTAGDAIEKAKKSIDDLYKGIYKNIADQKTSLSDAITKLVDPDALFQIQADRYTALLENGSYEEQMQAARSLQDLIISQYQEQGDTITSMIDSVKQIGQYLDSLKLNDTLSVLTPAQMLGEAQGQFQLQLSLARAGDADALSSITDFADTYLNKARSFYASSDTYTGIFDSVTKALGDIKAPDKEDYAKTTSAATTEAVTWLKSISASLDTIKDEQMLNQQNELSTGLSQAQGVRSEFIGGVSSATNTDSVFIEDFLRNGNNPDRIIKEYAATHTPMETYEAAIKNDVSSQALANATGWNVNDITEWAAQNGLATFADGGVTNRPAIFGEAGAEAAVPRPDGSSIPVTLSGGNNDALIEEIRALKQEVSELRREQADQTNALIESNYDANEQAAEKVSNTQEDVSWKNTQQVEIA